MRTENLESITYESQGNYIEGCIVLINDLHKLNAKEWGLEDEAVLIKAFAAVLCHKGKASLYVNGQSYTIGVNDLLICPPNAILQNCMTSIDFECRCICMSPEYVQQLYLISTNASKKWDTQLFLEKNPVLSLRPDEVENFCLYFDLLRSKMEEKSRTHHKEVVSSLLQAFLYEFHDTVARFTEIKPSSYSAGEALFNNFIEMLSTSFPKERMVAAYAEKLCVTPKYLSSVCKDISGETASELINQYVMKDIQYLLNMPDKSVKEVANELDFPSLSFFGKYVKKHLGMSPNSSGKKNQRFNLPMNFSRSMIKRIWTPSPTSPLLSVDFTSKVSFRPSTSFSVAVAETVSPITEGLT